MSTVPLPVHVSTRPLQKQGLFLCTDVALDSDAKQPPGQHQLQTDNDSLWLSVYRHWYSAK